MRTRLLICASLVAAAAASLGAIQNPKKDDADKPIITVTGCVDGSWLHAHYADTSGSYTERYKLRGSKQLLKEISSQYRGHLLEVTGAVTDTAATAHRGKTVQVGKKTRIYTGAKEVPNFPSGIDPILEIASYRDLKDSCK
jgi:hypothetical protein